MKELDSLRSINKDLEKECSFKNDKISELNEMILKKEETFLQSAAVYGKDFEWAIDLNQKMKHKISSLETNVNNMEKNKEERLFFLNKMKEHTKI